MKGDARALRRLDPAVRLVLLYGADTSASADLARSVARLFPDAEQVIAAATLTADPAALVAAASEIAMFGGARVIRVDDAGEDVLPAVAQVLDARVTGNPVVVVAGTLKKGSKLVARVEAAAGALAVVSHAPDAAGAARVVGDIAAEYGVRLSREAAAALAEATAGDRGIARQEVVKLALFVDATPATPVSADVAEVAAIGAAVADADYGALVDGVAGGAPVVVGRQLAEFGASTTGGIGLLRVVTRRFWLLLDLRAAVDGGASAATVVDGAKPPIFYRERPRIVAQLARWRTPAIRGALARLLEAERAIKRSGSAGDVAVDQLLLALAVQAAGR